MYKFKKFKLFFWNKRKFQLDGKYKKYLKFLKENFLLIKNEDFLKSLFNLIFLFLFDFILELK
jgi:hypothetical protein